PPTSASFTLSLHDALPIWLDALIMRIDDLFFAIPTLLVAIGIVALFGASAQTTILALGIAYIPFYARLVRGAVVGVRSRMYVDRSEEHTSELQSLAYLVCR